MTAAPTRRPFAMSLRRIILQRHHRPAVSRAAHGLAANPVASAKPDFAEPGIVNLRAAACPKKDVENINQNFNLLKFD